MADDNMLKQVKLGTNDIYELNAKYMHTADGTTKTLEQILAMHNLEIKVESALPTASAETMNALYLIPDSKGEDPNVKIEYVTVRTGSGTEADPYKYAWEQVGTSATDLSQYSKKTHTHSVTPASMTISATASGTAVGIKTTADAITGFGTHTTVDAITGFGTHTTDNALGEAATFTTTVTPTIDNIKATASGGAYSSPSSDTFLKGVKVKSSDDVLGTATKFTATPTAATTQKLVVTSVNSASATDKTASKATAGTAVLRGSADVGTAVSIPNVTGNTTSNAVTLTDTSTGNTAVASFSQGDKASWSANVDTNGVLSFSFTANGDDTFTPKYYTTSNATNTTLGTAISVTPAKTTTNTITPYTFADVECSKVTTSSVSVATGALDANGTGAAVPTDAIKSVSVAATLTGTGSDVVSAVTDVEADGTGSAITSLGTQGGITVNLSNGATAGGTGVVSVATGITSASTTVATKDAVAAITALGTATTAKAITALGTPTTAAAATAIEVTAQPTIKINDKASETVAKVEAVTTGQASE